MQAVTVPEMIAVRVVECSTFLTKKNITARPVYSAAIRLTTNPTSVVNSTPQPVSIRAGANIKMMANTTNKIEVRTESR